MLREASGRVLWPRTDLEVNECEAIKRLPRAITFEVTVDHAAARIARGR